MNSTGQLTDRQKRELEYHNEEHAELYRETFETPFNYDVVEDGPRRWWNQYWAMFTYLIDKDLTNKKVLVVGCGFGEDALNLAKAGAEVHAFDLSPESIGVAKQLAEREQLEISFREMTAENLDYEDGFFDIVIARDILHHVEVMQCLNEIRRVTKKQGVFLANEVYSHSFTHKIRYSKFIDKWLYPKMVNFIYGGKKPYITEDEEKLTEIEVKMVKEVLTDVEVHSYFNVFVTRIIPDRFVLASKADRILLKVLSPLGPKLGSRVLIGGVLAN